MIFITVGTHEQPFDRLLKCIDKLVEEGIIKEKIICQKGYTDYEPRNYKAEKLIPYKQLQENIKKARIIITHGGPASFLAPLSIGKIPIVVPRKEEFKEHINNHQVDFTKEVAKRNKNIIVVETEKEMINAVNNYESIVNNLVKNNISNNKMFNELLIKEIEKIF